MKNTVVLRDVKSNLVEEAIIVFRENVKIKEKQLIKGKPKKDDSEEKENLAMEEAENVILDYIVECEKERKTELQKKKMRVLRIINIALVVMLTIAIIF